MKNLADIMSRHTLAIQEIVKKHTHPVTTFKTDGSPVTELDLALSALVEKVSSENFPEACFYSEENYRDWKFPLLALDPLDGTREYVEHRPEWAISIGLFQNEDFSGQGWVLNPLTNELFTMETVKSSEPEEIISGEVSRTEYAKGLFQSVQGQRLQLTPKGSIAYKLGRLSHGKLDFVVSLRPKNIWDIAGGTLLCKEAGIEFYSQGKLVTKVEPLYEPPLIWCRPSLFPELSQQFSS